MKLESKTRDVRLYNVLFPIWLLLLLPTLWLAVLPANFIIDSAVLIITLVVLAKKRGEDGYRPWRDWLRSIWLVWIFGFAADIIAAGFMVLFGYFTPVVSGFESPFGVWWDDKILTPASTNPFGSIWAVVFVVIAIAFAGLLIYIFDSRIALRRLNVTDRERKCIALTMAIATAPYVMLLPSEWFWRY